MKESVIKKDEMNLTEINILYINKSTIIRLHRLLQKKSNPPKGYNVDEKLYGMNTA